MMIKLRRVVGCSMLPTLKPGQVVLFVTKLFRVNPGDIVTLNHNSIEKIKRVWSVEGDRVYLLGDNASSSTDSRHFGYISKAAISGKRVI